MGGDLGLDGMEPGGPHAPTPHPSSRAGGLVARLTRWLPKRCGHERVRCTHGDEIIYRRRCRRVCLDCGRSLKGPLPEPCYQTGEPHHA